MPDITSARPSKKGKEREQTRDPVPTDLAEKFIAHQRRTAAYVLSTFSLVLYACTRPQPDLLLTPLFNSQLDKAQGSI